jgi:hypothetical protein
VSPVANNPIQPLQPLGRLLVESGIVAEADVEAALAFASNAGLKLGQSLLVLGLIDELTLAQALAQQGRVPCIHLTAPLVDTKVARELAAPRSRRMNAIAINRIAGVTTVALEDPTDEFLVEELRVHLGTPVLAVHAEASSIRECIDTVFGPEAHNAPDPSLPPSWARATLDRAAAHDAIVLVVEPQGDHVRLHGASTGCRVSNVLPPRACAASIDGLLALSGADEATRSAMSAAITRFDPTVSSR